MKIVCLFIVIASVVFLSCGQNADVKTATSVHAEKTPKKIHDTGEIHTYLLGNWVSTKIINGLKNVDKIHSIEETYDWGRHRSFSFDSLGPSKFVLYAEPEFERIYSYYMDRLGLKRVSDTAYRIIYSPKDSSYLYFNTADSTIELHDFPDASKVAVKYKKVGGIPLKTKEPVYYLVNRMLLQGQYEVQDAKGSTLFKKVQFGERDVSGFGAFKNYQFAELQFYKASDGRVYPIVSLNVDDKYDHESLAYKKDKSKIYLYDYERPLEDTTIKLRGVKYVLTPL
jgi:hypothetical protein